MLVYDAILQENYTEQEAIEWAQGYDFSESEATDQRIAHSRYIETVNGVEVFYDYAGDYYFFVDGNKP